MSGSNSLRQDYEDRLFVVGLLRALTEPIHVGQAPRVEINLSDPEAIVLTIELHPRDETVFELFMEAPHTIHWMPL